MMRCTGWIIVGFANIWSCGNAQAVAPLTDPDLRPRFVAQVGHGVHVYGVACSPDRKLVLTGSQDNTARLWEIESGKELCVFNGHSATVCSVAFSPDGKQALTGRDDKTARLWDVASGNFAFSRGILVL